MQIVQLELPFEYSDFDKREIYRDHNPLIGNVSAFYTPAGIQHLDSEFASRIMKFKGNKKQFEKFRFEILSCLHLHQVIRSNLIANLERVCQEKGII